MAEETHPQPLLLEGRDTGGSPRVYCKFLGKMVEIEYCKKECPDRMPKEAGKC